MAANCRAPWVLPPFMFWIVAVGEKVAGVAPLTLQKGVFGLVAVFVNVSSVEIGYVVSGRAWLEGESPAVTL